jgi:hypothetical protein
MRDLPKYGFLTNPSEINGMKVIMLEPPYLIASIYELKTTDEEWIEDFLSAKAQGRFPVGKVKGYTVFLKLFSSLQPNNNKEFQQAILDEMAEFVLTERIQKKIGQFKGSDESGRTIKIAERAKDHAIRLRSRKNKSNE